MGSGWRVALLVGALIVLAGGFVVAQSASEDDGGEPAARTQPAEDPTVTAEGTGGTTAPQTTPFESHGSNERLAELEVRP